MMVTIMLLDVVRIIHERDSNNKIIKGSSSHNDDGYAGHHMLFMWPLSGEKKAPNF
jgi:hypothetical protein